MHAVAICSPERLFLDGLVVLLSSSQLRVEVVETSCRACLQAAKDSRCDLLVLDSAGLAEHDLEFVQGALAFGDLRCILISSAGKNQPGFPVVIDRSQTAEDLADAARKVTSDLVRSVIRGRGRPRMVTAGFELSRREYEIACLIAKGYTNRVIAEQMALKEQSVKNLVSTVIRKLHCENRVQVALRLAPGAPK